VQALTDAGMARVNLGPDVMTVARVQTNVRTPAVSTGRKIPARGVETSVSQLNVDEVVSRPDVGGDERVASRHLEAVERAVRVGPPNLLGVQSGP
jgi:hypothetical protein